MLSQVERNQANPTIAVLWRLANALEVHLADFLSVTMETMTPAPIVLIAHHAVPVIRSPDGKCELKILGPIELAGRLEWYSVTLQPGGVLTSGPHERGAKEHLSVLAGQVLVQSAEAQTRVKPGETARYPVDVRHALSNPGKGVATALLVVEYA